jgi:hypothetical protein
VYASTVSKWSQRANFPFSPSNKVVNFAKQVCDFPDAVESFLQTLGDGNWLPGGGTPGNKRTVTNPDAGEFAMLSKYLGTFSLGRCITLRHSSQLTKRKFVSRPYTNPATSS